MTKKKALRCRDLKALWVLPLHTVSLFELIDTSTGINQLLLAREERMAITANVHFHYVAFFGRAGLESSSTSASHSYFVIFGMYFSFHFFHLAVIFQFKCLPIITLFFQLVNCFCIKTEKILANFTKISYTLFIN